jgi:hypothetical protein
MAVRQIHETARTEAEVKRRSRELIAHMKWPEAWQTMQSYDHYFDAGPHPGVQDELLRRFERSLQAQFSAQSVPFEFRFPQFARLGPEVRSTFWQFAQPSASSSACWTPAAKLTGDWSHVTTSSC